MEVLSPLTDVESKHFEVDGVCKDLRGYFPIVVSNYGNILDAKELSSKKHGSAMARAHVR